MKTLNASFLCLIGLSCHFGTPASGQIYDFGTLAGFPSQGSADGSAATAQFFAPQGVAVDPEGNVYVADSDNSTIREISAGGQVTTIAGQAGTPGYLDGTSTNALFFLPKSVVMDTSGNLYVVDTFNDVVRKLTFSSGNWVVSTLAGQPGVPGNADGSGTNAAFFTPSAGAVDAAGNLYITDLGNDTIRQITPLGAVSTLAGQLGVNQDLDGTNRAAGFAGPIGITLDANTNLFVTDAANTLRRLAPVGTNWVVTTIAGQVGRYGAIDGAGTNALFSGPAGVTVDLNDNLYVADEFNETIRRLAFNGTNWISSTLAGSPGIRGSADGTNRAARFGSPVGVAADTSGQVFVADVNNNNIRQITLAGTNAVVTTLAGVGPGSTDGTGPSARFWNCTGIAVDASGHAYVADSGNDTIREITTNGVVTTIAGLAGSSGSSDGTNSNARFNGPFAVALDPQGNLYVADGDNNAIRTLTPVGTNWVVTTIAGNPTLPPAEVDGTNAGARFYTPTAIAVDANTNLYVTDSSGQTIRKISRAGTNWVVTTIAGSVLTFGYTNGIGTNALFFYPHGIVVDAATNVYVADTENDVIRKISLVGTNWMVTTIAGQGQVSGSTDGAGTNALFYFPEGLALDPAGNLYVADTFNDTLRRLLSAGGNWYSATLAGQVQLTGSTGGIGTNAQFYLPQGIALDKTGDLYVADTANNAIRLGQVVAGPQLQINFVGGLAVLSWPNTGTYTLQTNNNLSAPGWGGYGGPVTTANATNSAAIAPAGALFFRLSGP